MDILSTKKLANGVEMPRFGLGVYKLTDRDETLQAIEAALATGYRAIDTASLYGNEREVGEAVRASNISHDDIFITTKVWNSDQGYDATLRAFEISLKNLNMDYIDLYLTHWPVAEKFVDTYRAIERLYDEKLIRATGVSNHHQHHLEKIMVTANVAPMVNQVECHPYLSQTALHTYCLEHTIAFTAWSPLGRGKILNDETIVKLAMKYEKTPAQIILRWHLQNDTIIIPKSARPERIKENAQLFDFELEQVDVENINSLNRDERIGQNPDHFHFDF